MECSETDCTRKAIARGFCRKHYQRFWSSSPVKITPDDWGTRQAHPLYRIWGNFKHNTSGMRTPLCTQWREDFWKFVEGVGEKPGEGYRLFPIRPDEPLGPCNFYWKRSLVVKRPTESRAEAKQRLNKAVYGISLEEYDRILDRQGHVCAICGNPETATYKGNLKSLSIDHDHQTGDIRGLLCTKCNTGLGMFRDSHELLTVAAAYLRRHGK